MTTMMTTTNLFSEHVEEWFQQKIIEEHYMRSYNHLLDDENEEEEHNWKIYRGEPVQLSETITAYNEWLEKEIISKWNGLNIGAAEFVPESKKNKQKKNVSFTKEVVSTVFEVLSPDEYDRKYKDIDYTYYSNNIGITENSNNVPVVGQMLFGMAPPVKRSKTCSVLSVLGFE